MASKRERNGQLRNFWIIYLFPAMALAQSVTLSNPAVLEHKALQYSKGGVTEACGIRFYGAMEDKTVIDGSINLSKRKDAQTLGIYKMLVREVEQASISKNNIKLKPVHIHKAWIRTESRISTKALTQIPSSDKGGYVAMISHDNAMGLLEYIGNPVNKGYKVGFNLGQGERDRIVMIDQPISQKEASKFWSCMDDFLQEWSEAINRINKDNKK